MHDISLYLSGDNGARAIYMERLESCYEGPAFLHRPCSGYWPPVTSPPTFHTWFTIEVDDGVVQDLRLLQDEG